MASMKTRLNIKKLDENIVQKHRGSKQVGFKQLAPGVERGVSNNDTAVAQRWLEDKQSEEKTNTDCLVKEQEKEYQTGWKIKTGNVLDSCNQRSTQQCIKSGAAKHLGVARIQQQNGLVDETNMTLFAKVRCFLIQSGLFKVFWADDTTRQGMLEPVKVKCIFLRCREGIAGNKLWRLDEVTSKVVVYRKIGFNKSGEYKKTFIGSSVGMGSMQVLHGFEFEVEPLGDHTFELARDREQQLACELFGYREYSNEAALKLKSNDDNHDYYCEYAPGLLVKAKGNVLGLEIIRDQGEAWKKKIWLKGLLTESGYELRLVAGIATGALVKGGSRFEVPAQVKVAAYRY
ncbi:hypothetical protein Tco_0347705 [Tanacetum coccineum]